MRGNLKLSIVVTCVVFFGVVSSCLAQQVDTDTAKALAEQAQLLQQKASTSGGASAETLHKYGVDYTMLSVRTQDGGAELHAKFSDLFIVLEGEATLLSGGELENPIYSGPGEMRGTAVLDAKKTRLIKGDVVHIPPNVPHQLLVAKGTVFAYYVVKVQEK
jgi:mannose-6-phosphate isomerase-like protein (cupin superfamily)